MTAETIGIDCGDSDEERKRDRSDGDRADQLFGKTKLPSE
jgi:hypothetical protein